MASFFPIKNNIGRHTTNHIVINSLPVSRYHSCIVRIDGRIFIKDKQTINGTFIGKHKILPDRETLLKAGDMIGIGCRANENAQCTFEVVRIEHEVQLLDEDSILTQSLNHTRSTPDSSTDQSVNKAFKMKSRDSDRAKIVVAKQSNSSTKKRCDDNSVPQGASNNLQKKKKNTLSKSQKTGLRSVSSKTALSSIDTADVKPLESLAAPDFISSNVEVVQAVSKPEVLILAAQQKSDSISSKPVKPIESSVSTSLLKTDVLTITAEKQKISDAASKNCKSESTENSTEDVSTSSLLKIKTESFASGDDIKKSRTRVSCKSAHQDRDDTANKGDSILTLVDASNRSVSNAENVLDIIDLSKSDIYDNNTVTIVETTPESIDFARHQVPLMKPAHKMDCWNRNSNSKVLGIKTVPETCGPSNDLQLPETSTVCTIIDIKDEQCVCSTTPEVGPKLETYGKSVNFVGESSTEDVKFKIPASSVSSTNQSDHMPCINLTLSDDEQDDIKPCISKIAAYSTSDEIVLLDSDEEDFPCSQFDSTNVVDIPDFSSTFHTMYDLLESDDDEPKVLHSNKVTWFKSHSQSTIDGHYQDGKELKVDLPILKKELIEETRTNCDLNAEMGMDKSQAFKDDAPVICDDIDGCNITVSLNCVSRDVSRNEHSIEEMKAYNPDQFETLASQIKEKYLIRPCVVRIPQLNITLQKLDEKVKRKASDCVENNVNINKKVKQTDKMVEHKQRSEKRKKREHVHGKISHEKNTQPPTDVSSKQYELQELRKRREQLKEKLKKLAESQRKEKHLNSELNEKQAVQPVAIKVTNKNRSAFLMDSIVNDSGTRQTSKKKPEKIQMAVESATRDTVEAQKHAAGCATKLKTFDFLSLENQHSSREEIDDSYLNDQLKTNQDATSINLSVQDMDISEDESEKTTKELQTVTDSSSQKLKPRLGSSTNPSEVGFNGPSNQVLRSISSREALVPAHDHNVMKNTDAKELPAAVSLTYVKKCEVLEQKIEKRPNKSNLKLRETDENTRVTKKKVIFHPQLVRCKNFESNPEERRNNGIFAPAYKLHERLIREELFEFETAVAVVCKWNVKWLEEQKKCTTPPELYRPVQNWVPEYRLMGEYKERLKCEMYHNVWRAIFNSWNKPNQDILPHTQFVAQGNRVGLCCLQINTVDATRSGSLWTIYASREIGPYDCEGEIISGQIVILSFHVKQKEDQIPRKTMVFAYVASVQDSPAADGGIHQRIIFKIHQKDFEVMAGEIKIKTLTYTKTQLRPFQALSMVTRSPIMDMFVDPCYRPAIKPYFKEHGVFKDIFLDQSQKHAVITCMNSIISPNPSICIIDGAPGTGKSQVIVSLIHELFSNQQRNLFADDLKVLVVTSCDNIADDMSYRVEKFDKKDCNVTLLRYGNCKRVHHKIRYCTLDDRVQELIRNDDGTTLINLENERYIYKGQENSLELALNSSSATLEKRTEAENKLAAIKKILSDMRSNDSKIIEELKSQAAKEIAVENADVVVTSVHSCWSSHFENDFVPSVYNKGDIHKFTVCIFDDANYLNEIGMLIPMMLFVRSLILVGDSKNPAYLERASTSPFGRLVTDFKIKSRSSLVTLNTQHRMLPELSEWVCQYYGVSFLKKHVKLLKLSLNPLSVVNLLCDSSAQLESCWWKPQAVFCVRLLLRILDIEKSEAATIAVIILREEQRDAIKKQMFHSGIDKFGKVRVDTVEQFNGREKEIVIVCVPVNFRQLESWLYIASTRARSCLIICGYFLPTEDNRVITWLMSYAKSRNIYASCYPMTDDVPYSVLLSKI